MLGTPSRFEVRGAEEDTSGYTLSNGAALAAVSKAEFSQFRSELVRHLHEISSRVEAAALSNGSRSAAAAAAGDSHSRTMERELLDRVMGLEQRVEKQEKRLTVGEELQRLRRAQHQAPTRELEAQVHTQRKKLSDLDSRHKHAEKLISTNQEAVLSMERSFALRVNMVDDRLQKMDSRVEHVQSLMREQHDQHQIQLHDAAAAARANREATQQLQQTVQELQLALRNTASHVVQLRDAMQSEREELSACRRDNGRLVAVVKVLRDELKKYREHSIEVANSQKVLTESVRMLDTDCRGMKQRFMSMVRLWSAQQEEQEQRTVGSHVDESSTFSSSARKFEPTTHTAAASQRLAVPQASPGASYRSSASTPGRPSINLSSLRDSSRGGFDSWQTTPARVEYAGNATSAATSGQSGVGLTQRSFAV